MDEKSDSDSLMEVSFAPPTEQVSRNPQLYKAISHIIDSFIRGKISQTFPELQARINRGVVSLKNKKELSSLDDHQVEGFCSWLFNIFLLDSSTLFKREDEQLGDFEKENSARTQHELVHSVMYATSTRSSDSYIKDTYAIIKNIHTHISAFERKGLERSQLYKIWSGVRNQLAITRAFVENRYRVFLPNYAQDTLDVEDAENQVLQLDVRSGIDIIAVSPKGKIFLIDAKGRRDVSNVSIMQPSRVNIEAYRNPCVRKAVLYAASVCGASTSEVHRATIVIPTEGQSFAYHTMGIANHTSVEDQERELNSFGRLKPHLQHGIIDELEKSTKQQPNTRLAYTTA